MKTRCFSEPAYLGDPRNIVRIFNEKEVDELLLLDICATNERRPPRFGVLEEIVSEAFMPLAYGGGIRTLEDARRVLAIGVEKVVLCTIAVEQPKLVTDVAEQFGSQSVVVCIDVKKRALGRQVVVTHGARQASRLDPVAFAKQAEALGAGEIIISSVDRDGTMAGYDGGLIRSVSDAVTIPVIAAGGASSLDDLGRAVREFGAAAVAAGSLFVFHGRHRAVLISYPQPGDLQRVFRSQPPANQEV